MKFVYNLYNVTGFLSYVKVNYVYKPTKKVNKNTGKNIVIK